MNLLSETMLEEAKKAEEAVKEVFLRADHVCLLNQQKVLSAFHEEKISEAHLHGSTGYGYGDLGRDALDRVFARALEAEDALVRHTIVSGTHALSLCLFGVLRPGDTMLSITGKPYDTMEEVIGIAGEPGNGSLKDFGVSFEAIELIDGKVDMEAVCAKLREKPIKMAYIQRSMGYSSDRSAFPAADIGEMVKTIHEISPDTICMVDNCYGEFVEEHEPTYYGADIMAGSLIKNAGGSLARTGGYIAGRSDLVELVSYRLTSVGIGKEAGASLDENRLLYQGLFMAPHVVAQAVKTACFCGALFKNAGYEVWPAPDSYRADIIQTVRLGSAEKLIAFCQGIQSGSPIDAHVVPEPWEMPGYACPVIMAAGAFINGASIELSADGPVKPPYTVFVQGGITYESGKLGILYAMQHCKSKNV